MNSRLSEDLRNQLTILKKYGIFLDESLISEKTITRGSTDYDYNNHSFMMKRHGGYYFISEFFTLLKQGKIE